MVSIKSGKPYAKLKKTTPPPPKKEVLTKENPKKVKETSTEGSLENEKENEVLTLYEVSILYLQRIKNTQ